MPSAPMGGADLDAAFDALYRRHRERVLGLCRSMLRHPQDAEEAAQSAMLSAYRALKRGDQPVAVGAWLATIARNECHELIGRRHAEEPLPDTLPATGNDPASVVERRERLSELQRDLMELPTGQRTAVVLRAMAGMPHSEIARVVGGSEQAARTLVHEARESLGEFAAGRTLACDEVRGRISTGDGRAMRARRVRAHLRVCEGCRDAAGGRPSRLRGLLPFPAIAAAFRALLGGAAGPVAGGAAIATLATMGAVVLPGSGPAPADAAPARPLVAPASSVAPALLPALAPAAPRATGAATIRAARTAPAGTPGAAAAPGAPAVAGSAPATTATTAAPAPAGAAAPGAAAAPASGSRTPARATTLGSVVGDTVEAAAPVIDLVAPVTGAVAPIVGSAPVTASATRTSSGGTQVEVAAPVVSVPKVTTPKVTVSSVTTPSVTVPSITAGPVTTPSVTVPEISTPPLATPEVSVPQTITTPSVAGLPTATIDLEGTPTIGLTLP